VQRFFLSGHPVDHGDNLSGKSFSSLYRASIDLILW
jgi:hypothetical protein